MTTPSDERGEWEITEEDVRECGLDGWRTEPTDALVSRLRARVTAAQAEREKALREAVRAAAEMVDQVGDVDLHELAYEKWVARTGRDDGENPSRDDYAEAFVEAVARAALEKGGGKDGAE